MVFNEVIYDEVINPPNANFSSYPYWYQSVIEIKLAWPKVIPFSLLYLKIPAGQGRNI